MPQKSFYASCLQLGEGTNVPGGQAKDPPDSPAGFYTHLLGQSPRIISRMLFPGEPSSDQLQGQAQTTRPGPARLEPNTKGTSNNLPLSGKPIAAPGTQPGIHDFSHLVYSWSGSVFTPAVRSLCARLFCASVEAAKK